MGTTHAEARKKPHYVNNREFSQAVNEYVIESRLRKENDEEINEIPRYIGDCIIKICEGLSHKPNFIGYTFRDEMVGDAIFDCIRAIHNYNIEAATKSKYPNAFGYFTKIASFAFLRRIAKEKKYFSNKMQMIAKSGIDDFVDYIDGDHADLHEDEQLFLDSLKERLDEYGYVPEDNSKKKTAKETKPSPLDDFMGEDDQ